MFPALLRFWRNKQGLSQLELALQASVSAKHISFLELGRSHPSREMILALTASLDVPLRERNTMLREAGYTDAFDEPPYDAMQSDDVRRAIALMLDKHEPYPMIVMDKHYDVLQINRAAHRLFTRLLGEVPEPLNGISAFFDPSCFRPHLLRWEELARELISRLQRDILRHPHDDVMAALLREVLASPDVPKHWRQPDLSERSGATLSVSFRLADTTISFLTTVTTFSAPRNVTLEELRIEGYFPCNEATEQACLALRDAGE